MKIVLAIFLLVASLFAQSNTGELRLKVTTPAGLAAKSSVEIICEANHYRHSLLTDDAGNLTVKRRPFGAYLLEVRHVGFAPFSGSVPDDVFVAADNLLNQRYDIGPTPVLAIAPPILARAGLRLNLGRR